MTGLAPGALDDGRAIGSLSGSGAVPAVRASNWHPFPKKRHIAKKSGFPASPIPACAPDIGQDFLANADGRDVPRLELIRNMDRVPLLLDIGVANVEAVCAENQRGAYYEMRFRFRMASMVDVLPWIQPDDETATNYGGVVYQETPCYVDSLPPQMRARQRQRIGIGIVCIHSVSCFFCVCVRVRS